jgi:hypothetical protein
MMNASNAYLDLLTDLDARQDDLILKLDELNRRVEQALVQCQGYRAGPSGLGAATVTPPRDR